MSSSKKGFKIGLILIVVIAVGLMLLRRQNSEESSTNQAELSSPDKEQVVSNLVGSEELILNLQQELNQLSKSALNLSLPDSKTREQFASIVKVKTLESSPLEVNVNHLGFRDQLWQSSKESVETSSSELTLLDPLFAKVDFWEHFKFKLIRGHFDVDNNELFWGDVHLNALAVDSDDKRYAISGDFRLKWQKQALEEGQSSWKITEIDFDEIEIHQNNSQALFAEVLDSVIPDKEQHYLARRSYHEELAIQLVKQGAAKLPVDDFPFAFQYDSSGPHPGLAVVDINKDGWDDLYVMVRWGNNQLYVNQGDGTFVESAKQYGLDVNSHSTSAVFADFDNDGDPDLFLGRYEARSIYFENQNGKFVDQSQEKVKTPLPGMVVSVSAADYNGDGLLDVYFSTYGNKLAQLNHFLPVEKVKEINDFYKDHDTHHVVLHSAGAPNQLLINLGGTFDLAPESKQLEFFQTSFQSTWADYDQDGDPDLYVCNDFGPDYLMRNDFPNGFKDVTSEIGDESMRGFGMGVTWGDYDLDGRQDMYVSAMYSKAGMRITSQLPEVDEGFRRSADGNRLYRQGDNGFEYVSGLKAPKLLVAKVGWSWGGQFVDFDNDGFLDLYVSSGYFTAPDEVAIADDL